MEVVEMLTKEDIPVMGHLGLVPRKSTSLGGMRAIGKTTNEAIQLYNQFKRLEDAGAFAAECEVIPENVMGEISKRTNIVTVSLGAGKNADVMYLFMEDICGDTENLPRHSKAYGNLLKLRNEIKIERVRALKAFRKDSMSGKFPGKKQSSNLDKIQFEEFLNKLD
jgi:3-methyl-2-oxobutanoate hydroxymethyltransferase